MWRVACVCVVLGPGCAFFEELEDAESAESGSDEEDGGDRDGACDILEDDRCDNQDILRSCDPGSGEMSDWDCGEVCGENINLSCILTPTGQHSCYCVAPGKQKVLSCSELDDCVSDCGGDTTGICADNCFGRTIEATVRMYGALLHCAYSQCQDMCVENPGLCAPCVDSSLHEGAGACGLERSVCDTDRNGDPLPFPG